MTARLTRKNDALAEIRSRAKHVADVYTTVAKDRTLRSVREDAERVARALSDLADGRVDDVLAKKDALEAAAARIEKVVMARETKSLGPHDAVSANVPGVNRWLVINLLTDCRKAVAARARTAHAKPPTGKLENEDDFWALIARVERKAHGDLDEACARFTDALRLLDDKSVVRAGRMFANAMRRAFRWDLWGAAYVIHGGCSDDAFWDFRAGLVALGRDRYEGALADPDSLARIRDIEDRTLFEGFQYVPGKVIEERALEGSKARHHGAKPVGRRWKDDAELADRFPRLWKRFGE